MQANQRLYLTPLPLLAGALVSRLAPNTTLASVGLVVVGALGGGVGTRLSPGQRAGKQRESTER